MNYALNLGKSNQLVISYIHSEFFGWLFCHQIIRVFAYFTLLTLVSDKQGNQRQYFKNAMKHISCMRL